MLVHLLPEVVLLRLLGSLFLTRLGDSQSRHRELTEFSPHSRHVAPGHATTTNVRHNGLTAAGLLHTTVLAVRDQVNCQFLGQFKMWVRNNRVRYDDPEFLRSSRSVAGRYHGDVASASLSCFETSPEGVSHTGGWKTFRNSAEGCCESRIRIKLVWFDVVHIRLLRCSRPSWCKSTSVKSGFQG